MGSAGKAHPNSEEDCHCDCPEIGSSKRQSRTGEEMSDIGHGAHKNCP